MYEPEFIKQKLLSLGFTQEELDLVCSDVDQVILQKFIERFTGRFKKEEIDRLKEISDKDEIKNFIKNKIAESKIPLPDENEIIKIYNEVWDDYFGSISSNP